MNNKIAIYLRLSLSDGDLKKGSKDESNSIENQRLLLHSYIEKQNDLSGEIVEYVDDGYTGTNFNRPAFQKMIINQRKTIMIGHSIGRKITMKPLFPERYLMLPIICGHPATIQRRTDHCLC